MIRLALSPSGSSSESTTKGKGQRLGSTLEALVAMAMDLPHLDRAPNLEVIFFFVIIHDFRVVSLDNGLKIFERASVQTLGPKRERPKTCCRVSLTFCALLGC